MNEINKALSEVRPTLVELYNPKECACRDMAPVVDELRSRLSGKANIIALDGTAHQEFMREYKVAGYPCWILFKDGQEVWRDYGKKSCGELEHMVREFV